MRRVVVTGMGIVSSIGDNVEEVTESLRLEKSGITFNPEYEQLGLRSHVCGNLKSLDKVNSIPKKMKRFMGDSAAYGYVAMQEALASSEFPKELLSSSRTGLIFGSGGASTKDIIEAAELLRTKGVKKVGPYRVTATMGSSTSACLSTSFGIKGISVSMTSACATSAHCIGYGMELIQFGKQDVVFAGGADSLHWSQTCLFDAMGALSSKFNNSPETASRPYDQDRDGFVIAEGAGVLILEEMEHALARGAKIYGEVIGYGASSDGYSMVAPSGEGAQRSMKLAMETVKTEIDYVNTHGTSTPVGDLLELDSISEVFKNKLPYFSSTKSLSGHSLGAAGVHEAIYSLIMMKEGFMASSSNVFQIDPKIAGRPLLTSVLDVSPKTIMSNSFGFGGSNVSLVFSK
ncbi:beta-ketoacyl synthase N-terminal-like domain-containing protein [Marinomonas foliarum]|uniref:3-oxoacyl-[acyl-carrier-protein] synthase 1 n=1 Tax=Marinomonas foliarum TaxID=491950 RepID=A0ABX7IM27_9GAMM|nr:beta-ketoacyl synthase N-terminal-like domain-containing protein [Marinomonas foliarum]QRV23392.1 beta-ketoacyl-ACP synthase I [Marinomonas foliarum]|tara:strand:- start:3094 stop:4302 length:1209 start_codon:yes stop_codon:yes gene_type:complete